MDFSVQLWKSGWGVEDRRMRFQNDDIWAVAWFRGLRDCNQRKGPGWKPSLGWWLVWEGRMGCEWVWGRTGRELQFLLVHKGRSLNYATTPCPGPASTGQVPLHLLRNLAWASSWTCLLLNSLVETHIRKQEKTLKIGSIKDECLGHTHWTLKCTYLPGVILSHSNCNLSPSVGEVLLAPFWGWNNCRRVTYFLPLLAPL